MLKSLLPGSPAEGTASDPIDPQVIKLINAAVDNVRKVGGRPEVIVVSEPSHARHLKGATAILGMRVEVRSWMPDGKLLIESEHDLAKRDAMYANRDA